jgi:hypothetical protein
MSIESKITEAAGLIREAAEQLQKSGLVLDFAITVKPQEPVVSLTVEPSGKSPPEEDPRNAGVREFMTKRVIFEPDSLTEIRIAYERYLDYFDFCDMDIEAGDAFTRCRFNRLVWKEYGDKITERIVCLEGRMARCFSGMRLIDEPSCMPREGGTASGDLGDG